MKKFKDVVYATVDFARKLTGYDTSDDSDHEEIKQLNRRGIYHSTSAAKAAGYKYKNKYTSFNADYKNQYRPYGYGYHASQNSKSHAAQSKASGYNKSSPHLISGKYSKSKFDDIQKKQPKVLKETYCSEFLFALFGTIIIAMFISIIVSLPKYKQVDEVQAAFEMPQAKRRGLVIMADNIDCSVIMKHMMMREVDFRSSVLSLIACLHITEPHTVAPDSNVVSTYFYVAGDKDLIERRMRHCSGKTCDKGEVYTWVHNTKTDFTTRGVKNLADLWEHAPQKHEKETFMKILYKTRHSKSLGSFSISRVFQVSTIFFKLSRALKTTIDFSGRKYETIFNNPNPQPGERIKLLNGSSYVEDVFFSGRDRHGLQRWNPMLFRMSRGGPWIPAFKTLYASIPNNNTMSWLSLFTAKYITERLLADHDKPMDTRQLNFYKYSMIGQVYAYSVYYNCLLDHTDLIDCMDNFFEKKLPTEMAPPAERVSIETRERVSSILAWGSRNAGKHQIAIINLSLNDTFASEYVSGGNHTATTTFRRGNESISTLFTLASQIFVFPHSKKIPLTGGQLTNHPLFAVTCSGSIRNMEAVSTITARIYSFGESSGAAVAAPSVYYNPLTQKFHCEVYRHSTDQKIFNNLCDTLREETEEEIFDVPDNIQDIDRNALVILFDSKDDGVVTAATDPRSVDFNYPTGY